jgi:hypothetical protein
MVQIAAHLNDHVLPPLPVRQWVLSGAGRRGGIRPGRGPGAGGIRAEVLRAEAGPSQGLPALPLAGSMTPVE